MTVFNMISASLGVGASRPFADLNPTRRLVTCALPRH
jgi:hypothetical protein